jgi:3-dehydroquinate synthase
MPARTNAPAHTPVYAALEGSQTLEFEDIVVRKSCIHLEPNFVNNPRPTLLVENEQDPFVVITDETVFELYTESFTNDLKARGCNLVDVIVLPASEQAKTMQVYTDTLYRLEANTAVTGDVTLVALGGAVVSNVTGFLAATLKRGVRFVSMPTTLLAQCDGCISFKQAVNGRVAKNQFGAFYAPSNIILDMSVLNSLPARNFLDGFGEVIKHAICQDQKMVAYLESMDIDAMLSDRSLSHSMIWQAVQCKLQCMANCPPENHAVLQYGHQFGHGVEKAANFLYGHGECVGLGMVATDYLGLLMGFSSTAFLNRTTALVHKFRLPITIGRNISLDKVWDAMVHDKAFKNGQHRVNFAHPVERNHEFIVITHELVRQALSFISSYEMMFANGGTVPKVAFSTCQVETSQELIAAFAGGVRHFACSAADENLPLLNIALGHQDVARNDLSLSVTVNANTSDLKTQCVHALEAIGVTFADIVKLDFSEGKYNDEDIISAWQAMESLVRQKLATNIAVANTSLEQLQIILSNCAVRPVSLDLDKSTNGSVVAQFSFCETNNIRLVMHCSDLEQQPTAEVAQAARQLQKTPTQLLLRTLTARGMGLVLKGAAVTDLVNFNLDFTLPPALNSLTSSGAHSETDSGDDTCNESFSQSESDIESRDLSRTTSDCDLARATWSCDSLVSHFAGSRPLSKVASLELLENDFADKLPTWNADQGLASAIPE